MIHRADPGPELSGVSMLLSKSSKFLDLSVTSCLLVAGVLLFNLPASAASYSCETYVTPYPPLVNGTEPLRVVGINKAKTVVLMGSILPAGGKLTAIKNPPPGTTSADLSIGGINNAGDIVMIPVSNGKYKQRHIHSHCGE